MAKLIICDACREKIDGIHKTLDIPIHLTDPARGGYCDQAGNSVSGRSDSFDLCMRCYNDVMGEAVAKLHRIQLESRATDQLGMKEINYTRSATQTESS